MTGLAGLIRATLLAALLLGALSSSSGCAQFPEYSTEMRIKLARAKASGIEDRIETPKNSAVALGLGFVFPAAGEFYAGDIGDGLITCFTFWTGYGWVKGIIDGFLEARYRNDLAIIEAWEKEQEQGILAGSPPADVAALAGGGGSPGGGGGGGRYAVGRGPPPFEDAAPAAEEPPPPAAKNFCKKCGAAFASDANFCEGCGQRR